jgi:uncharacterized membrane protein
MTEKNKPNLHFKNTFITGLITVVPLALTVFVSLWLFHTLTDLIPALLRQIPNAAVEGLLENRFFVFAVRLIGLGVIVLGIYFVGLITKGVLVRQLLGLVENVVERLPMVGTLYSTIKQMGHAILRGGGAGMFQKTVMLEYPRKGCYVIAFLTSTGAKELTARTGQDLVAVFVPTTPNPTSGFLLLLPRDEVMILDMTVMEGMRMVISGGAVTPPWREKPTVDPEWAQND